MNNFDNEYRHHADDLTKPVLKLIKALLVKHDSTILKELHAVVNDLKEARKELNRIRKIVQAVLDDSESKDGGWGPDVTMLERLRDITK